VPYRQEQLEVSPSEAAEIQAAVAAARTSFAAEAPPRSALQSRLAALMAGGARKVSLCTGHLCLYLLHSSD